MDELKGFVVEAVQVLVDHLSGDVGLRLDGGDVLVLSEEVAAELGRDLLTATRHEPRCLTPAKWVRR